MFTVKAYSDSHKTVQGECGSTFFVSFWGTMVAGIFREIFVDNSQNIQTLLNAKDDDNHHFV